MKIKTISPNLILKDNDTNYFWMCYNCNCIFRKRKYDGFFCNLNYIETKTVKKTIDSSEYEETVLPFPEGNNLGLIGISFREKGKSNLGLACVGGVYIKSQFASSYEKRKEVHPIYC